EAKQSGRRAWEIAGLPEPAPTETAFTISLDEPAAMADAARKTTAPLLKIKLGGERDMDCLRAVRSARADAIFIVDPNEGWTFAQLQSYGADLAQLGVRLIEHPLPADADAALEGYEAPVPICADESLHTLTDLPRIAGRYAAVNIKLDK